MNEPWLVLTSEPEILIDRSGNSIRGRVPSGPSIDLAMNGIDRSWIPDREGDEPIEIIAIGHFDDDRSTACPPDQELECRERFVVDSVAWANGHHLPRNDSVEFADAVSTVDDVVSAFQAAVGRKPILSMTGLPGDALYTVEPTLRPAVDALMQLHPGYRIVRLLEGDLAARYLVIDGTDAVYGIGPDGLSLIAGTPPSAGNATPSPTAFGATVRPVGDVPGGWEVTFRDGEASRGVTVIDRTGTLLDVRLPTAEEARSLPIDATGMQWTALDANTSLVGWGGTPCELELGLEVERLDSISLGLTGRAEALCRSKLMTSRLVLVWAEAPGDLGLTDARGSTAFPATAAGLPVVPISEATAIRDTADDHEVAIKGWFSLDPRSDCGASDVGPLLDPGCRSPARAGTLVGADGGDGIRFVTPNPGDLVAATDGSPVVLVGHFDDPRAEACANPTGCQDVLFVDSIWIDGRLTSGHWSWGVDGSSPEITADVINRLLPRDTPHRGRTCPSAQ